MALPLAADLNWHFACDFIYASDKAKLGFPETTLGIHPGFGGTQRTAKLVGLAKAKELIFTGKTINAQEAYEMGLVNKVVPHDQLMNEVLALAEKMKKMALLESGSQKSVSIRVSRWPAKKGLHWKQKILECASRQRIRKKA